ncbi:MAG TPA: serine/threonine-protein kinase [Vicinamibacteria bacterium]|nr:serine/threonine-protein kinase [Vicinamibacteria bacterium]
MPEALPAGARVGAYEVLDRLGGGGMGTVYRARDTRLGRTVALKVLRSDDDPELLRRFDREARAASALNHPNIVQIYDVGVGAGQAGEHYVVMEYVEGETLRRRLARGPLPILELLDLGAQLADGLAKAHRAGIVHRDLKPENLMVTPDGLLKILDFGLAKVMPAPLGDLDARETLTRHGTQAGMLLGTLEYMSPEQASGRAVDSRTDQFAAGLVLAEMATGRPLFRRDTPAQVLAAVIERDPEPLGRLREDVPPALEALVSRCLQKDPARRFATTDDLASELATLAGRSRAGSLAAPLVSTGPAPAVSAEVVKAPSVPLRPAVPALYHVQKAFSRHPGRRKVREYGEAELADQIRRGRLTGVELVRREGEERWQPLYESQVFRREVPSAGDARDAARWRVLRALGGHFTGFFVVGVVMFSTQGHLPFWMAIWGAVLAAQVLGTLPVTLPLLSRRGRGGEVLVGGGAAGAGPPKALPAAPSAGSVPSAVAQEASRVRALIEERGGKDASRLLAEVDGIVKVTAELAARQADLEEQTSDRERAALASALAEARLAVARVSTEQGSEAQDRRLFQRQLDVLERRDEAITKAMRVLHRVRIRRELAEHQLKQLRLDLSRGAAVGLDVPELSSRLEYIRHEVDAREEVEEIDAATD